MLNKEQSISTACDKGTYLLFFCGGLVTRACSERSITLSVQFILKGQKSPRKNRIFHSRNDGANCFCLLNAMTWTLKIGRIS